MYWSRKQIEESNKIDRLKLVNAISGIKPANLVGTISKNGISNLAIISSVLHLSSNPATMGFVMRPNAENRRDTYKNICEMNTFTINHIPIELIENAHYTSAKFPASVSEFEECGFKELYIENFDSPFVQQSPVKIGLVLKETIPIPSSGTLLVVGSIEHVLITDEAVWQKDGYLNLEKTKTAGISGLNSYYKLQYLASYPYARIENIVKFNEKTT